jgi:hypothetical protein
MSTYPNRVNVDNGSELRHTDTICNGFVLSVQRGDLLLPHDNLPPIYIVMLQDYLGQNEISKVQTTQRLYSWSEVLDYLKAKAEQSTDYLMIEACVRLISRINAEDSE